MRKEIMLVLSTMLLLVAMSMSVFAAETGATVLNNGSAQSGSSTGTQDFNISAGQVQEVNLTGESITSKWAGFYGNLGGGVALSDGANDFYTWSVSDFTGAVVYAAEAAVTDWSTLKNADTVDVPAYLIGDSVDNFSNTYGTELTFNSPTRGAITANATTTLGGGSFESFALDADAGTIVWGAEAVNDGAAFNTDTVDYQLLVPAQTDTTYYFYMELP